MDVKGSLFYIENTQDCLKNTDFVQSYVYCLQVSSGKISSGKNLHCAFYSAIAGYLCPY